MRRESISLSPSADNSADALAQPRVERVANPLAQEVVRQHRGEDREARIDRQPPADLDRVLALAQDVAPRGVRRLHAQPKNESPDSARIAAGIPSVIATSTGAIALGRMWRQM